MWSGAITPTSARVNGRIDHDSTAVRLLISINPDLSNPLTSDFQTAFFLFNRRMVTLLINGLQPGTPYYYVVESNGNVDTTAVGRLKTPMDGPFPFTFAFASCAETGSNHSIFTIIRQHEPLFYLNMGDLHYRDIGVNDRDVFRQAYDDLLAQPNQAALYRDVPFVYMWDDHDYGPNDSDTAAPGREAARLTYQEYVPHYPLAAGSGDVAIYQAFTIGRVRFILTDTRSARTLKSAADDADKSMMGAQGINPVIVWVSTSPWIADPPGSGDDNWAGYATERRELADFVEANGIEGLVMLSGDVHMVAIDDGRHNRYSSSGARGFPVMQAAPLDRTNATYLSDNIYSEGQFPGHNQFGLMTVTDDGGPVVRVRWSGRDANDHEFTWHEMTMPPSPRLAVDSTTLFFLWVEDGARVGKRPLTIMNLNVDMLNWTIRLEEPAAWLRLSASSGSATFDRPARVEVGVDTAALDYGLYRTRLRIAAGSVTHSPQFVTIMLFYTDELPDYLPVLTR